MNHFITIFLIIISILLIELLFNYDDNYLYVHGLINQSKSIQFNDKSLKSEIVFKGLEFPVSMAFLGKDDILILEKNNGTVKRIINGTIDDKPLIDLNVANIGERGLLGIAISKSVQKNNHDDRTSVFLYLTESPKKDGDDRNNKFPIGNRIYKFDLSDNGTKLINKKLMMKLPSEPGPWHNGGKIIIGPDDNLYFTIGDVNNYQHSKITNTNNSIKPDGRAGILRMTQNGDVVKDDFTLGKEHPLNKYFAYGIRNSLGIDFDPVTGNLWDSEIGPAYGEEINLVKPGFNSGWGIIQGFWEPHVTSYDLMRGSFTLIPKDLVFFNDKTKYSPPELTHVNPNAFTAIKFLDSNKLGEKYKNTLLVGEFNTGKLYNFKLNQNRTGLLLQGPLIDKVADTDKELDTVVLAEGFGGIVDIQVGPDGYLYVLSLYYGGADCVNDKDCYYSLRTPGTIFRIVPIGHNN